MNLIQRCEKLGLFFENLEATNGKLIKESIVKEFRDNNIELEDDLNFCFEVLAGKHKIGYTYNAYIDDIRLVADFTNSTVREFV